MGGRYATTQHKWGTLYSPTAHWSYGPIVLRYHVSSWTVSSWTGLGIGLGVGLGSESGLGVRVRVRLGLGLGSGLGSGLGLGLLGRRTNGL